MLFTMIDAENWKRLCLDGYAFLHGWSPDHTTLELARSIGTIVDVPSLLPCSSIPTVQSLKPRHRSDAPRNQYSSAYGVSEFPLHTDLAHWVRPPRYFVLRCITGSPDVDTRLAPASRLAPIVGEVSLRQAVTRPHRLGSRSVHCLLPLMFRAEGTVGFRWDPLFLVPMNGAAHRVAEAMSSSIVHSIQKLSFTLSYPGDTLIVDNWRILHGRGSVASTGMNRCLERVYLTEILA